VIGHGYREYIAQILHRYVHRSWSPLVGVAGDVRDCLVHAQLHIAGSTLRQAMLPRDLSDEFSRGANHARARFCCEAQRSSHRRLRDLYPTSQRTKQRRESQAESVGRQRSDLEMVPPRRARSSAGALFPNHKTLGARFDLAGGYRGLTGGSSKSSSGCSTTGSTSSAR